MFALCRSVGCAHPDLLLEQLTPAQLWEWWELYNDEPWGEQREDLRACAVLGASVGVRELTPLWPYYRELTLEEIASEAGQLPQLLAARARAAAGK